MSWKYELTPPLQLLFLIVYSAELLVGVEKAAEEQIPQDQERKGAVFAAKQVPELLQSPQIALQNNLTNIARKNQATTKPHRSQKAGRRRRNKMKDKKDSEEEITTSTATIMGVVETEVVVTTRSWTAHIDDEWVVGGGVGHLAPIGPPPTTPATPQAVGGSLHKSYAAAAAAAAETSPPRSATPFDPFSGGFDLHDFFREMSWP